MRLLFLLNRLFLSVWAAVQKGVHDNTEEGDDIPYENYVEEDHLNGNVALSLDLPSPCSNVVQSNVTLNVITNLRNGSNSTLEIEADGNGDVRPGNEKYPEKKPSVWIKAFLDYGMKVVSYRNDPTLSKIDVDEVEDFLFPTANASPDLISKANGTNHLLHLKSERRSTYRFRQTLLTAIHNGVAKMMAQHNAPIFTSSTSQYGSRLLSQYLSYFDQPGWSTFRTSICAYGGAFDRSLSGGYIDYWIARVTQAGSEAGRWGDTFSNSASEREITLWQSPYPKSWRWPGQWNEAWEWLNQKSGNGVVGGSSSPKLLVKLNQHRGNGIHLVTPDSGYSAMPESDPEYSPEYSKEYPISLPSNLYQNLHQNGTIQEYIEPLLVEGPKGRHKFTLRWYFLIASYDPLQIYLSSPDYAVIGLCREAYFHDIYRETEKHAAEMSQRNEPMRQKKVNRELRRWSCGIRERGEKEENGEEENSVDYIKAFSYVRKTAVREGGLKTTEYLKLVQDIQSVVKNYALVFASDRLATLPPTVSALEKRSSIETLPVLPPCCYTIMALDLLIGKSLQPYVLEANAGFNTGFGLAPLQNHIKETLFKEILQLINVGENFRVREERRFSQEDWSQNLKKGIRFSRMDHEDECPVPLYFSTHEKIVLRKEFGIPEEELLTSEQRTLLRRKYSQLQIQKRNAHITEKIWTPESVNFQTILENEHLRSLTKVYPSVYEGEQRKNLRLRKIFLRYEDRGGLEYYQ